MPPGKLRRFDFDEDEMDILRTAVRDHYNWAKDTWVQRLERTAADVLNVETLLNRLDGKEG
jgi:hypothetical protein